MLQSRISVGDIFREVADGAVAGFLVVPRPSAEEVRVALCRREDPRHEVEVEVPLEREGAPVSVAGSSPLMGAAGLFLFRFIFFVNAPVVWLLGKRTEWKKGAPQRPRAFEPRAKNRNLFFFFFALVAIDAQALRLFFTFRPSRALDGSLVLLSPTELLGRLRNEPEDSKRFGIREATDSRCAAGNFQISAWPRIVPDSLPALDEAPISTGLTWTPRRAPARLKATSTKRCFIGRACWSRNRERKMREREEATGATAFQFFLFESCNS